MCLTFPSFDLETRFYYIGGSSEIGSWHTGDGTGDEELAYSEFV